MIEVRRAESEADLEGWIRVKRAVLPNESAWTVEEFRTRLTPDRTVLVAELDGEIVGAGLGGRSDDPKRGYVAPRVHPGARRHGVGTALLEPLVEFVESLGLTRLTGQVIDPGSKAFAERYGFAESDRQVEQVRPLDDEIALDPLPEGVEVVTIADRDLKAVVRDAPENISDLFNQSVAEEIIHQREAALRLVESQGGLALDVTAAALAPALLEKYLQVKERGLL